MNLNLNGLFHNSYGRLIGRIPTNFNTFKLDSREIVEGDIFVAVKGSNFDGHDFAIDAIQRGAVGIIVEKKVNAPLAVFQYIVPSTNGFLLSLGEYARNINSAKFIGITGSAGKTTTKEMVYSILGEKFKVLKTPGNLNTDLSLPIFMFDILKEKAAFVIVEMGVQKEGDMDKLVKIVQPNVSVILNIGEAHLEFLKDRNGVAKEKFKIMNNSELSILNLDDDIINKLSMTYNAKKFFFGTVERADLIGKIVHLNENNMELAFTYLGKEYKKTFSFSGLTFFYDMMGALSVSVNIGMRLEDSLEFVSHFSPLTGRGKTITLANRIKVIDETYNSNPLSLRQSIKKLVDHKDFLVVIIGDMLELGENAKQFHKEAGEIVSYVKPDVLVIFGEYGEFLRKGAIDSGLKNVFCFKDKEKAILFLKTIAIPENSTIFIKGSRGMKMEDFIKAIKERFENG
jgi:UDP-N-acetylmuramoyl-tripeptide--D-alanyl-D-alanine ligase